MSSRVSNHRFKPTLTLALAALSLFVVALPLSPAKAQCLGVDLGFACGGLGVGSWYSHPYYYAYPSYYPNYSPYYYGYYYGYPYYGGPAYSYTPYGHPDYGYQ